jgi:two-component system chemotaxis sensor kinase CheA
MNDSHFQKKLLDTFKVEAEEHLRLIIAGLLKLERHTADSDNTNLIEDLRRETHSLKGAVRTVNLVDAELICQTVESAFLAYKRQQITFSSEQFDVLHQIFRMLQHSFEKLTIETVALDKQQVSQAIAQMNQILHQSAVADVVATMNIETTAEPTIKENDSFVKSVRTPIEKLDHLLLKAEELLNVKLLIRKHGDKLLKVNEVLSSLKKTWESTLSQSFELSPEKFLESHLVQVKSLENSLALCHADFDVDGRQINYMIDSLLEDAKSIVMLPFSTLVDGFPAMVRHMSREHHKEIHLEIEGGSIEIDKRTLEALKNPLLHLIRNSIAHGIEMPNQRHNKPTEGTIRIRASQTSGNELEVIVSDDGCGINVDAVKAAAIKNGMLSDASAKTMDDQAVLSLIFRSGISTSTSITNLAGQGLGMAIVQEKIAALGGYVNIKSEPTMGTEVKLTLPLVVSTFKGVLIRIFDQLIVLPITNCVKTLSIDAKQVTTIENKSTIVLDDTTLSFLKLHNILDISPNQNNEPSFSKGKMTVVILQFEGYRIAFQVDEVYGVQDFLIKKLNKPLIKVKYVYGATILETSEPVLILNVNDLMKSAMENVRVKPTSDRIEQKLIAQNTILVVEDSITTRMLFKNILEMAGYQVKTAVDGLDAWRVLREDNIELVVSDIEMPRMDGFQLTKKIRDDKKIGSLPVVLVTSRESQEDREYGIDVGANAYLVKSNFDDSNFLAIIKRLL